MKKVIQDLLMGAACGAFTIVATFLIVMFFISFLDPGVFKRTYAKLWGDASVVREIQKDTTQERFIIDARVVTDTVTGCVYIIGSTAREMVPLYNDRCPRRVEK